LFKKGAGLCDSLPWEGVGRGFIVLPIPLKWRINPSLPLHIPATPLPREGIKESSKRLAFQPGGNYQEASGRRSKCSCFLPMVKGFLPLVKVILWGDGL